MLPLKMGLATVISPFSWGFEFTNTHRLIYAALALAMTAMFWKRGSEHGAVVIALVAITLFFGITNLPWPAIFLLLALLSRQLSGPRLVASVLGGMVFILVSGIRPQAMLSLYLCGMGVILSFALGTSLGILAAEFDGVWKTLRPINDTL